MFFFYFLGHERVFFWKLPFVYLFLTSSFRSSASSAPSFCFGAWGCAGGGTLDTLPSRPSWPVFAEPMGRGAPKLSMSLFTVPTVPTEYTRFR